MSECDNSWTFAFKSTGGIELVEARPIEFSMKRNRKRYDYCRVKFNHVVGEELKPATDGPEKTFSDPLSGYSIAVAKYDGQPVHELLFKPDWIKYGRDYTHVEFKDLQYALKDGNIDVKKSKWNAGGLYDSVISFVDNDVIQDYKFNVPKNQIGVLANAKLPSGKIIGGDNVSQGDVTDDADDFLRLVLEMNFDFDDKTPETVIQKLNQLFGYHSWIEYPRTLVIGIPEAVNKTHLAAPNDERVWRYKNPTIAHSQEPIKRVFVEGKWYDDPGWDPGDIADEIISWGKDLSYKKPSQGGKDVQAVGIAERTDIKSGKTIAYSSPEMEKENLKFAAETHLIEELKETDVGTVEIDYNNSGAAVSHAIHDVAPGDAIRVVPDDKYWDSPGATTGKIGDAPPRDEICSGFVNNANYFVKEVEYNLTDGGYFSTFLDLATYPNMEIKTKLKYYDPSENEYVDERKQGSWYLREGGQDIETDGFDNQD